MFLFLSYFVLVFLSSDLPFVTDMDLAVVISATSPNAGVNFAKIKEIIQDVIEMYGVQRVYYSVILFGRDPTIRIRFNQQFTEDNLRRSIDLLPRPSSGVSLDAALQKAKDAFDEEGRSNTRKVVIVVVDQKSDSSVSDVKKAAGYLEEDGIKVIPVAFGKDAEPDEMAATTTNKANVIQANETSDPKNVAKDIVDKVAEGMKEKYYMPAMCVFQSMASIHPSSGNLKSAVR